MKNDDLSSSGQRLLAERKRLGVKTQEDLAQILGVKKNSIVRYERHNGQLKQNHISILKEHGFDVDFIMYGDETNFDSIGDLTDDQKHLLRLFNMLPEQNQSGLLTIVETYVEQFKPL